jgi:hypothetical protein
MNMGDDSDRCESLALAYETLERANRTIDQQQRAPVDDVYVAEAPPLKWDAANPRKLTVATMTQREYNAWVAAGKPALTAPVATVTKAKADDMVRAAVGRERAHVAEQLEGLVAVLGEEVAAVEKKIRSDFSVELAELRAQLHELRNERSAELLDLPNWRGDVVQH